MKKFFFILFTVVVISTSGFSQQLPLFSNYISNCFLYNPGVTGSLYYMPVSLNIRQQWTGISDAPSTQVISMHSKIKRTQTGIGGYFFNDRFGPISQTGIQASYAYHITITKDIKLGLGLSVSAFQFKINKYNLNAIDDNDIVLTGENESFFIPDANLGAYLYTQNYFAGFSTSQNFQHKIQLHNQMVSGNQTVRHYYLTGGYLFDLNDDFDLQPSFLIKTTHASPLQLDISLKARYKDVFLMGLSFRSDKTLIPSIGVKFDQYYFGYAFDYSISNSKRNLSDSHELLFGVNLGRKKSSSALL